MCDSADAAGWQQAPDDEAADMYLAGARRLDRAGYEQYEISNVRVTAFPAATTSNTGRGLVARLRLGAHSTVGRALEERRLHDGLRRAYEHGRSVALDQELDDDARIAEALFTGLRLPPASILRNFQARMVSIRGYATM